MFPDAEKRQLLYSMAAVALANNIPLGPSSYVYTKIDGGCSVAALLSVVAHTLVPY